MVWPAELCVIKALDGFVINPGDSVAIREQLISIVISHIAEDGSVTNAAALQQLSAPLHFRINFLPSESSQE